jgi:hypothetical protein
MLVPTGRIYDIRAPFSSLSVALFPLAPTSEKLCLDSICDPHESQTSLVSPSSPYPPDELVQVLYTSLHFSFLEEIDTLEYSWVKTTMVSVHLRIYL